VLQWIDAFLSNRKQRVTVRRALSEWSFVTSGVRQGSILSPTLFIIFVNDSPDCIQSYLGILADDIKLYRPISSCEDPLTLQDDINSTLEWCDTWLSFLNFPNVIIALSVTLHLRQNFGKSPLWAGAFCSLNI